MKWIKNSNDFRSLVLLVLATFSLLLPLFGYGCSLSWIPLRIFFIIICFAINHNHQHLNICTSNKWNQLLSILLSVNIGQSGTSTIAMHQLNHHAFNNSELDLANSRQVKFRWNFLNLIFYPFIIVINYRKKKNQLLIELEKKQKGLSKKIKIELWAIRFIIIIYLIININIFIWLVLIPYAIGLWAILAINLIQHHYTDQNNNFNESSNFTGLILNYFLLNSGYHSAHHRYPSHHWSLLPDLHKNIEKNIPPGFIRKSFALFIVTQFLFKTTINSERKG